MAYLMKVTDWFKKKINENKTTGSYVVICEEAKTVWPYVEVAPQAGYETYYELQAAIFTLNKQIKKESAISSYYPMVMPLLNNLYFFFTTEQEKQAAITYLETNNNEFKLL